MFSRGCNHAAIDPRSIHRHSPGCRCPAEPPSSCFLQTNHEGKPRTTPYQSIIGHPAEDDAEDEGHCRDVGLGVGVRILYTTLFRILTLPYLLPFNDATRCTNHGPRSTPYVLGRVATYAGTAPRCCQRMLGRSYAGTTRLSTCQLIREGQVELAQSSTSIYASQAESRDHWRWLFRSSHSA